MLEIFCIDFEDIENLFFINSYIDFYSVFFKADIVKTNPKAIKTNNLYKFSQPILNIFLDTYSSKKLKIKI